MLTLDLEDFTIELDDGTVKHVGTATTSATVKLYDVEEVDARAYGDKRLKLSFEDGEGNELEVALDPEDAIALETAIDDVREEGPVFE